MERLGEKGRIKTNAGNIFTGIFENYIAGNNLCFRRSDWNVGFRAMDSALGRQNDCRTKSSLRKSRQPTRDGLRRNYRLFCRFAPWTKIWPTLDVFRFVSRFPDSLRSFVPRFSRLRYRIISPDRG